MSTIALTRDYHDDWDTPITALEDQVYKLAIFLRGELLGHLCDKPKCTTLWSGDHVLLRDFLARAATSLPGFKPSTALRGLRKVIQYKSDNALDSKFRLTADNAEALYYRSLTQFAQEVDPNFTDRQMVEVMQAWPDIDMLYLLGNFHMTPRAVREEYPNLLDNHTLEFLDRYLCYLDFFDEFAKEQGYRAENGRNVPPPPPPLVPTELNVPLPGLVSNSADYIPRIVIIEFEGSRIQALDSEEEFETDEPTSPLTTFKPTSPELASASVFMAVSLSTLAISPSPSILATSFLLESAPTSLLESTSPVLTPSAPICIPLPESSLLSVPGGASLQESSTDPSVRSSITSFPSLASSQTSAADTITTVPRNVPSSSPSIKHPGYTEVDVTPHLIEAITAVRQQPYPDFSRESKTISSTERIPSPRVSALVEILASSADPTSIPSSGSPVFQESTPYRAREESHTTCPRSSSKNSKFSKFISASRQRLLRSRDKKQHPSELSETVSEPDAIEVAAEVDEFPRMEEERLQSTPSQWSLWFKAWRYRIRTGNPLPRWC
ncbi:hypothetical protein DFP72DRAFT_247503 [Ephemerocybe angulata]|uniref:Uncharacterized protein n=1 Tax=Ephemerocybe angulata TaxID=980116 RepID=A0A8H6I1J7_9AGAR|nr:hypothetical protein DFP72DRAFT_247503 [Tulosesus angulatus]